jgi:hypothetical protein
LACRPAPAGRVEQEAGTRKGLEKQWQVNGCWG